MFDQLGNVELPAARYNHSAATIETDYWIFGGENSAGDILGDIWCADINSKKLQVKWKLPTIKGTIPSKRKCANVAFS